MKAGDAEIGSVQVHNDLCGISDDYLIDIEFSEDSRGMGSVSNGGPAALVSKIPLPNFAACKPDFLGTSHPSEATDHLADCHDKCIRHKDSELHIIPQRNYDNGIPVDVKWSDSLGISHPSELMDPGADCHIKCIHHEDPELHILPQHNFDNGIPVDDKWSNFSTSFALHDLDKLEDVSVHPTNHSFYDKDNANMFLYYDFSDEGISTPSTLKQYGESTQAGQSLATGSLCIEDAIPQGSTQPHTVDGLLTDSLYHDKDTANMFLYYNFSESEGTSSPLPLEQCGESIQACQSLATESLCVDDAVAEESTLPSSADDVPMPQKRIRKPTRRYIDESVDIGLMSSKKRKVPTSTSKGKVLKDKRVKDKTDTLAVNLVPEEFVVKPIQVPFGSLVGCKNSKVLNSDDESEDTRARNCPTKLRSNEDEDQKERDHIKKLRHKHNDGWRDSNCIQEARSKEYDDGQRVSNGYMKVYSKENSAKRIGDRIKKVRQERDDGQKVSNPITKVVSEREDSKGPSNCLATFRTEENLAIETAEKCKEDGKRKHHRLWTISEIKKLIEGVSQHGVGRWTDIKRLYFSMSNHRTSVDLKDKWRNLLKASRLQKQSTTEGGHRRNLAWRPLPHTILNRVNDLATIYPYPRTHKSKIVQVDHDSSPILMLTGASGVTE